MLKQVGHWLKRKVRGWVEGRRERILMRDTRGAMSIKEFVVFTVIVFFGFLAGNFLVQLLGIAGTDIFAQLLAFIIPTLIVYVLWKWLGASASKK